MNSDKFKRQIESMWKHRDTDEKKRLVKFTIAKTMRLALEYPELAQEYFDSLCKVIPDNERITVSNYQHNLTSDAEEEELLTCKKSKAMQLYSHLLDLVENERMSEHYSEWCDLEREYIALFGENVFADYFGSKRLLDAREVNFATKKPQPAETKNEGTRQEQCVPKNAESGTHSFSHILKDSFRKERRLNIAAQIVASMIGSDDWTTWRGGSNKEIWHNMAKSSLEIADALIAEAEKGGIK